MKKIDTSALSEYKSNLNSVAKEIRNLKSKVSDDVLQIDGKDFTEIMDGKLDDLLKKIEKKENGVKISIEALNKQNSVVENLLNSSNSK